MPALNDTAAGLLTILALLGLLALAYVPVGDYLAAVLTPTKHSRFEKATYRLLGVNPDGRQNARSYTLAVVGFSVVSIVVLFAILVGLSFFMWYRAQQQKVDSSNVNADWDDTTNSVVPADIRDITKGEKDSATV